MNSISTLKKIVANLSKKEINLLIKHLDVETKKIDGNKSFLLFNLLRKKSDMTINEIQKIIYGKVNYYAFNKLSNRLKDTIYDIMILDGALLTYGYSNRNSQLFTLRKRIIQADIMQLRGLNDDVVLIYNSIILKSSAFEFYEVLLQALNSKLRFLSAFGNKNEVEKLKNEIKSTEINWLSLNHSQSIYQSIMNKISSYSDSHVYSKELDKSIIELNVNFKKTNSSIINYYRLNLEIEQAQISQNYIKSNLILLELENLTKNKLAVYTENRYGTILLNIANNYLLLKDYELSIYYAEKSRGYFKSLHITQRLVDEIIFYCKFYQNKYSESEKYIQIENWNKGSELYESLVSKFNYYRACLLFRSGQFNDCVNQLNYFKEIEKDKEGWNIARRILIILSRIEQEEYDSLDLSIENLNKYLKRLSSTKYLNPRFIIILKILVIILRENIDWKRIDKKKNLIYKHLETLKDDEMKWQIKSPELINFEDWVLGKLN